MSTFTDDGSTPKTTKRKRASAAGAGTTTRKRASRKTSGSVPDATPRPSPAGEQFAFAASDVATSTAGAALETLPPVGADTRAAAGGALRPQDTLDGVIGGEERRRMIAQKAYGKSLERPPGEGSPRLDWCEAEAEIDGLLARRSITLHA